MATQNDTTASRFHNLSAAQLADEIGRIDAIEKAASAEKAALKAEMALRAITEATGAAFAVTLKEQISARLDTKAVRAHLGKRAAQFEVPTISEVLRVKPVLASLADMVAR